MLIKLNSQEEIRIRLGAHLFYLRGDGSDGLQLSCLGSTLHLKPILDYNVGQDTVADQVFIKAVRREKASV